MLIRMITLIADAQPQAYTELSPLFGRFYISAKYT